MLMIAELGAISHVTTDFSFTLLGFFLFKTTLVDEIKAYKLGV